MALSVCVFAVSPAPVTSFISLPLCRTSKQWRLSGRPANKGSLCGDRLRGSPAGRGPADPALRSSQEQAENGPDSKTNYATAFRQHRRFSEVRRCPLQMLIEKSRRPLQAIDFIASHLRDPAPIRIETPRRNTGYALSEPACHTANCAAEIDIAPSDAEGHMNFMA